MVLTKKVEINPFRAETTYESLLASPSPTPAPDDQTTSWLIAIGAILSTQNDEELNNLRPDIPQEAVEELKLVLIESWGIYTKEDAVRQIKWLKRSGHNKQFEKLRKFILAATNDDEGTFQKIKFNIMQEMFTTDPFLADFAWEHRNDLAEDGIIAWDMGRLVNVARWSYTVGYISEEEALEAMAFAGKKVREKFNSWDEFADNYRLGRAFWLNSEVQPELELAINKLKTDPESPWKKLDWNLESVY